MTEDEFKIQEPKDPFECFVQALKEDLKKLKREELGVNDAFAEIITFGSCSEIIGSAHDLVKEAFMLDLPGITHEEQEALYDKFEDLWDARREQLNRSFRYVKTKYAVTKKEADE